MQRLERRKEDPVIIEISQRLDKLEDIYDSMNQIKEWMETVTRVFRGVEIVGCFCSKWAARFLKVGAAVATAWAAVRLTGHEVLDFFRSLLSR